ncbi:MAG TPA: dethiobiotin synthase, partial [Fibrobacteria bacterium]|nr:dethiobiotin synthase [Fibrobacteria bacterium]
TGTEVGKSALALGVLAWARDRGLGTTYCKPVQCGDFPFGEPPAPHGDAEWMRALFPAPVNTHVIHRFRSPVSPHLAAERERTAIDLERVRREVETLVHQNDLLVVEGAGGAAAPLDRKGSSLGALAGELGLPCLIACAPGLGTLHHTLSTIAYLERAAAPLAGFAFCSRDPELPEMYADNLRTLRELTGLPCFGTLPHLPALSGPAPLDTGTLDRLIASLAPALDSWWKTGPA